MKYIISFILISITALPSCTRVDPESEAFQDAVVKAIEAKKEDVFKIMTREARESQVRKRKEAREKARAEMEEQFKNPLEPAIEGRYIMGRSNAPITIIEYSDFQCPACKRGTGTVAQVMNIYRGKVRLIFKHLPLNIHKNALVAAKGGIAAEKQGKFKEYKRILFNNQRKINRNFLLSTARSLGMNVPKFTRDMDSPETEKIIRADMAEARKFGITGTPGFVINGVALKGAYPLEKFKEVIERHLK
jgi:protein-disulfide isomerase